MEPTFGRLKRVTLSHTVMHQDQTTFMHNLHVAFTQRGNSQEDAELNAHGALKKSR